MGLFHSPAPALAALAAIEPDELTPKQALEALYRLKGMSSPVEDSADATPSLAHPVHPVYRCCPSRPRPPPVACCAWPVPPQSVAQPAPKLDPLPAHNQPSH